MCNEHAPMVNLSEVEQDSETFGELGNYGYPSQSILIKLSIKQAAVEAFLTDFLAVVSHCIHSNWFSSGQFLRGVIRNSFAVSFVFFHHISQHIAIFWAKFSGIAKVTVN